MTLFFLLRDVRFATGVADELKFTRESRGRREDNRTSSISVGLLEIFLKVLEVGQLTIVERTQFFSCLTELARWFQSKIRR